MPDLIVSKPIKLSDHFSFPADTTEWGNGQEYLKIDRGGRTPARDKAPFGIGNAIVPKIGQSGLYSNFGIYLVAAEYPTRSFYVGIAAFGGLSPEGILKRIRKHRIKITGSNIGKAQFLQNGVNSGNAGGVDHTLAWRSFAKARYQYLQGKSLLPDSCSDLQVITASTTFNDKRSLEEYEVYIKQNIDGARDQIYSMFWPGCDIGDVFMLTSRTRRFGGVLPGRIIFPS